MKSYLQSCKYRIRSVAVALALMLALASGGSALAASSFQNFDTWQQGGFHGMGLNGDITDKAWSDFESTGANLARVFVRLSRVEGADRFELLPSDYRMMDSVVGQANRRNFKVVVTFSIMPKAPDLTYWSRPAEQDSIVAVIGQFAARYAGESAFAGFDLLNEPYPANVEPPSSRDAAWNTLASRIIRSIRAQDPTRTIVYEFPRWSGNYEDLRPIPFEGVVYSSHWYTPHDITHQGMDGRAANVPYPTPASHRIGPYNRAVLKELLQPMRAFQQRYQVPIFFGEFSCVRWAPGNSAYNYVTDVASIFDEFNWNWAYLGFRSYRGWDAEKVRGGKYEVRSMNTDLIRYLKRRMTTLNP